MREVSMPFQVVTAERPASSPARKSSRRSPSGVLIDIPVIAIRRCSLDKIGLHDGRRADYLALEQLARADGGVVVEVHQLAEHGYLVARADLGQEQGVMDPEHPQ